MGLDALETMLRKAHVINHIQDLDHPDFARWIYTGEDANLTHNWWSPGVWGRTSLVGRNDYGTLS